MESNSRFLDSDTACRALKERVSQRVETHNKIVHDPAIGLFALSMQYIPDPDALGFTVGSEHMTRSVSVKFTAKKLIKIDYFYQKSEVEDTLTWHEQVVISEDPAGNVVFKRNGVLNTTDELTLMILQPMLNATFAPPENAQASKP
jgi:hypothetical protein